MKVKFIQSSILVATVLFLFANSNISNKNSQYRFAKSYVTTSGLPNTPASSVKDVRLLCPSYPAQGEAAG